MPAALPWSTPNPSLPSNRRLTPLHPTSEQLARLAEADPRLGTAMAQVPEFPDFSRTARRFSAFHYLCRSIVYQQLAGAAAKTIYGRVRALTPGRNFPTPAELLALPEEELRGAGLSRNKMLALKDLARRVESRSLRLRGIGRLPDEAIVERLIEVRGIGVWTAQMFLLFKLGRLDVMPATDLGVREGLRRLDELEERPTPKAVLERSEVWRPLRSVASWVLWRLTDAPAP